MLKKCHCNKKQVNIKMDEVKRIQVFFPCWTNLDLFDFSDWFCLEHLVHLNSQARVKLGIYMNNLYQHVEHF